jgi:hypothetical protein
MMDIEKWKRISGPLYTEEFSLMEKAQDSGLSEEEHDRLKYLTKLLERLLSRFLKDSYSEGGFSRNGPV